MKKLAIGLLAIALLSVGIWQWMAYEQTQSQIVLQSRVNEYWQAKVLNDMATMYGLEASKQSGELAPDQFFAEQMGTPVEVVGYSIQGVTMEDDRAKISLEVAKTFPALAGGTYTGEINDNWIRVDGAWYHDTPGNNVKEPAERADTLTPNIEPLMPNVDQSLKSINKETVQPL